MAKRKSGGGAKRDRFINRYRGRLNIGNPATSWAGESFNTGMNVGRENPNKWVITHFALWPNLVVAAMLQAAGSAVNTFKAQLAIGNQTALLNGDDMQVICEATATGLLVTSGYETMWPLVGFLPAPVPVFAQALTVMCDATVAHASLDGLELVYEIGYVVAPINEGEIVEYLSAFGQV